MTESGNNNNNSTSSILNIKEVSLPSGGGSIQGMGDSFQPDFFSGSGKYAIPVTTPAARGLEPTLTINYNSGNGNSEFGLGFSLSLANISLRTDRGIPKYDGSDLYTLQGVGELVKKEMKEATREVGDTTYTVLSFLPRIENSFAKIEQWINASGLSWWKVVSKDNITSYYGRTDSSRISNPDNKWQIFEWLIDETVDAQGNRIEYTYKCENDENVPPAVYETNRSFTANRYLQSVKYGNYTDSKGNAQFAFQVIFDYGEYELSDPATAYDPVRAWACRTDPFSSYKSGFEIRTFRLCRQVLLFQYFNNESVAPLLARAMSFNYKHLQQYGTVAVDGLSLLSNVSITGYRKNEDGSFIQQDLPPVELDYAGFVPPSTPLYKTLSMNGGDIPGYLDQTEFLPVDLHGDGLPGFLYSNNESVFYLEPKGNGEYASPSAANTFPIDRNIQAGQSMITDIDGNGRLEIVTRDVNRAGYYESNTDGSWDNFAPFQHYPNDIDNPAIEATDCTANGKTDLLLPDVNDLLIYYSEGNTGYTSAKRVLNDNGFPLKKARDRRELVTFATIFGDGLAHRVRITNGSVECWPCLGYGQYGKKVTLANAPFFEKGFDNNRLFLADTDGSGTTDLIYIHPDRADVYLNQSGNSFSAAVSIQLPCLYSEIDRISFADILGNGTSCMIVTTIAPTPVHYYYNFAGEVQLADGTTAASMKPYLLNQINNNLGKITTINYCSSTRFYLEDKQLGKTWLTKLPFPVQVVSKITVTDKIAASKYISSFKYHDGYYDTTERQFCGFGFVETWDAELFKESESGSALYVPPVYTKTWYHTGVFLNNNTVSKHYQEAYFNGDKLAYDFPGSVFQTAIYNSDSETWRQAYFALQGSLMRKEVYAEDNSTAAACPYTVEAFNVEVVLLQTRKEQPYAVFMVNERESIAYNYERNPNDPAVQQRFVLETDLQCGQVKRSCTVYLPRRTSTNSLLTIYPEQLLLKATAETSDYINTETTDYRWKGILCQQQQFELIDCSLDGNNYCSYDAIKEQVAIALQHVIPYGTEPAPALLQARQLTWTRTFFWDEAQAAPLPLQQVSARALVHHQEAASFTNDFISKAFNGKLSSDIITNEGGYFFDADSGYWWNKSIVHYYYPASQPALFFLPFKSENSFVDAASSLFAKTVMSYDQPYAIFAASSSSYLEETVINISTYAVDYQACKYKQITDINGNVNQVLFDPLAQVIATTLFGLENGESVGGMRIYEYNKLPPEYVQRFTTQSGGPITFDDVLANPEYYLQGAASYFYYNLHAWTAANDQPVSAINLLRQKYYYPQTNTPFECQTLIEYSDGLGRSIEKKQLADSNSQWLVSGRVVYNNKAKPCEAYLPYFSDTPYYEVQSDASITAQLPPPTVTYYDPLLRVIRVDTPKGFFTKTDYAAWQQSTYDEDDTVKDSTYYTTFMASYPANPTQEQKDEKDALDKAALFYNTPGASVLDNTGKSFLTIQMQADGRQLVSLNKTDIQGRTILSIDPRLYNDNINNNANYYNFKYLYSMGGETPLCTDSADAGIQTHFSNIFGNLTWSYSARNYCQRIAYDKMQRKTQVNIKKEGDDNVEDDFNLVEYFTYGEYAKDAEEYNLRGQVYQVNDLSGIIVNSSYSLQAALLKSSRQMAVAYKTPLNWNNKVELEADIYSASCTYDALGALLTQTSPDGSVTTNTYNLAGLLQRVAVAYTDNHSQAIVDNITYNANRQRTNISYGNGITSSYTYEDTTLRLIKLHSKKPDTTITQNLQYTYDPVGNITRTWDYTFETVFNNNQQVDPLSDYTYDALYRLTDASGRQHAGINGNTYKNNKADNSFMQCIFSQLPSINDADKLENYKEHYTYDDAGNLVKKQHVANSASFTVDTPVRVNCNWLQDFEYDASGNQRQLQINNAAPLYYNCCENLVKAGIIERPGEPDDGDYYLYDSKEMRTRKVNERLTQAGAVTEICDKIYLGNYEVKRNKTVDASGKATIQLERQTLRVMDNDTCIAIIHYWVTDNLQREVDVAGERSIRFQMGNNLNSVSLEMDANALLISYEEYFPYGGTAIIAGEKQQEVALKEYRYSGKECDDSTGLYYYGMRYYVPWLGRWLKPDPAGTVDGLNLFAFVSGNPIVFTDTNGEAKKNILVSQKTMKGLQQGQEAIDWARSQLPYAGNVTDDVTATRAESTARFNIARDILGDIWGNPSEDTNAIARAASAIGAHGGACNEFSALTHTALISHQTTQPIIRVWDDYAHHSFTLIGDPRALSPNNVIVVDAWPSQYQVSTLTDTRWDKVIGIGNLDVHTETPLVSSAEALLNAQSLTTEIARIPAEGQPGGKLPIYNVNDAFNNQGTGKAGRRDPRGGLNYGETYTQYNQRTMNWNGMFGNDYSTSETRPYEYYTHVRGTFTYVDRSTGNTLR